MYIRNVKGKVKREGTRGVNHKQQELEPLKFNKGNGEYYEGENGFWKE